MILGIVTAVKLFRCRRISSDLQSQIEALISHRKSAEAVKETLETNIRDLEGERDDLKEQKHRLQAEKLRLETEKERLEQQVVELTRAGPRIHGVWKSSQTFWHLGRRGMEEVMQIGGRIHLTSSNTDQVLHLLAAYIDGKRLDFSEPVSVRPDLIEDEQVVLYISPPLESDVTRPFTATIVLEDHENRMHTLPTHTFQPSEQIPPWVTSSFLGEQ